MKGLIVREGGAKGILGAEERGQVILETPWKYDEKAKTVVFKKGPATRKKAYADLLLAKEKEMRGMTDQLHEAGFASIFAVLEGRDLNCPVCLCTIGEPTVTQCCHVYCRACILAQLEEAGGGGGMGGGGGGGNVVSRCAVCRKPVSLKTLMQLDTTSVERYEATEEGGVGREVGVEEGAGGREKGVEEGEEEGEGNEEVERGEMVGSGRSRKAMEGKKKKRMTNGGDGGGKGVEDKEKKKKKKKKRRKKKKKQEEEEEELRQMTGGKVES